MEDEGDDEDEDEDEDYESSPNREVAQGDYSFIMPPYAGDGIGNLIVAMATEEVWANVGDPSQEHLVPIHKGRLSVYSALPELIRRIGGNYAYTRAGPEAVFGIESSQGNRGRWWKKRPGDAVLHWPGSDKRYKIDEDDWIEA